MLWFGFFFFHIFFFIGSSLCRFVLFQWDIIHMPFMFMPLLLFLCFCIVVCRHLKFFDSRRRARSTVEEQEEEEWIVTGGTEQKKKNGNMHNVHYFIIIMVSALRIKIWFCSCAYAYAQCSNNVLWPRNRRCLRVGERWQRQHVVSTFILIYSLAALKHILHIYTHGKHMHHLAGHKTHGCGVCI